MSYGDYVEQLTYLIFLKMADEYSRPPYHRDGVIPVEFDWQGLVTRGVAELEGHYVTLLHELGTRAGTLGQIFTKSQNNMQDPAKLYRLIEMVDDAEWVTMGVDIKWPSIGVCLNRPPPRSVLRALRSRATHSTRAC